MPILSSNRPSTSVLIYLFLKVSVSALIGSGLIFISQAYLGKTLGVNNFGEISFYNTIVTYFLLLTSFGFETYFIKPCLNDEITFHKALSIQLTSRLIATLIIFIIVFISYLLLPKGINLLLCILSLRLLPYILSLDWYLKCKESFGLISTQNILKGFFFITLATVFVRDSNDTITAATIFVLVDLLSTVVSWLGYKDYLPKLTSFTTIKNIIKKSFVVSASFFMISLYYNIDNFALGIFRSSHEVGLYSAAYRFLLAGIMPTGILLSIYTPTLASNIYSKRILSEYIIRTLILGVVITITLLFLNSLLIDFTFGQSFEKSKNILYYLTLDIIPCYLAGALINPLNIWGYHKEYFWIVFFGGMFNIITNFTFIPFFGIPAAVTTTILSEVIVALLGYVFIRKKIWNKLI